MRLFRNARCAGAAMACVLSSAPVLAADHYCYTTADFTTALSNASLASNDTITLHAANTFTAPAGGFVLPQKSGTGWITIRSSNHASLPANERVFPSDAANMPDIRAAAGSPAIKTAAAPSVAHHYKLVGLEIIAPADNSSLSTLVQIGVCASSQNSDALTPNNIVIDRCYLHDNSSTQPVRRLVEMHGISVDITNSYLSGCKFDGQEAQAIWGVNGRGPFNIINNYIEGSSMSVFFGGTANFISNMTPTDIEVKRNHFFKPLAWKTTTWWVKNHFELKCGKDVVVDGNIFENCWLDAGSQYGASIVLKCIQGAAGNGSSWFVTENVTVTNNIVRNVGIGVVMAGSKDANGNWSTGQPANVTVRNNLLYNVNTTDGNSGWVFQTGAGSPNITIDHNTAFHSHKLLYAGDGGTDHPVFAFTNNMSMRSTATYGGIQGGGAAEGEGALASYYPSAVYQKNVQMGATLSKYDPSYLGGWNLAPFNNSSLAFPTSWSGVLQNQGTPGTDFSGYKVVGWNQPTNTSTYPYNNTGTDNKDIGCDIDQLNAATAGCISGVWANPPTTITLKNGVNGYTGATSFYVRGQAPTTHYGSSSWYHEASSLAGTNGYVTRAFYKFDVSQAGSGIPSGSTITNAKLKVKLEFRSHTFDYGISCYRMAPASSFTVNYATATRNTYNGTNSWTGGANAAGEVADTNNDYLDTVVDNNSTIPLVGEWIEFDVTSAVQAWVNGTANNGLLIKTNPGSSTITVRVSTPADLHGSAEYPTLEVTYQ